MAVVAAVDAGDSDSGVIEEADRLADALETELIAVHVVDREEFVSAEVHAMDEGGTPMQPEQMREYATGVAAEVAAAAGVEVTPVGLVGDIATQLDTYAREHAVSHIVVDGRKRSPIGKVVFSAVTQQIMLASAVPVVAVLHDAR
jgi:nucleotide-binding universal stress UspA family protein